MFSVDDLRFIVKIAGSRNLADAARQLDVTPSAVTQRLKQVEGRAGVRLVDRSARQMTLTGEGELVTSRGRTILYDIDDLTQDLEARRDHVSGELRIVAPLSFGRRHVAHTVSRFCGMFPDVKVDLCLSEHPNAVVRDNFDLAIHIGDLKDSNLKVRHVAPNRRILCAAPSYIDRVGHPRSPDQLRRHSCLSIRENKEDVTMWHLSNAKRTSHIRIDPRYSSNDGEVVRNWVKDGLGIMVRSEWDVFEELRDGHLVQLLPNYSLPAADVVVLFGARSGRAARTTAFIEALKGSFPGAMASGRKDYGEGRRLMTMVWRLAVVPTMTVPRENAKQNVHR